jgi:hypothetical protein
LISGGIGVLGDRQETVLLYAQAAAAVAVAHHTGIFGRDLERGRQRPPAHLFGRHLVPAETPASMSAPCVFLGCTPVSRVAAGAGRGRQPLSPSAWPL